MTVVIKVDHITKRYPIYKNQNDRLKEALNIKGKKYHKDFYALKDVSFEIKQGECVGFVGKNGSGKSTLLKILTGVLSPTSGKCEVNGRISALLELGAGFNSEYTGIENIYLNGSIMGYSREEMEERIQMILDFADIGDFVHQPVKTYSSGMFVRLAFAVAINVDPDILIIDEALSVGDIFFQLKCYKKFEDFKKNGKTIVFVTHDLSSVIRYCDRAILLNKGNKICEGNPKEIVDEYKRIIFSEENNDTSDNEVEQQKETNKDEQQWKTKLAINPNRLEYGNKRAEIIDFAILNHNGEVSDRLEKGGICTFCMKIKFHYDIENPIYAFAIKDIKGMEITGTNTMLEKIDTDKGEIGQVIEISFEQEFNLQCGTYFLSFGCVAMDINGELEILHRLYDVLSISIYSQKVSTGFFDMNSKIRISSKEVDS